MINTIACPHCSKKQNAARTECYNCQGKLRPGRGRKPADDPPYLETLLTIDPYVNEDRFIVFDPTNKHHMRQVALMLWGKS